MWSPAVLLLALSAIDWSPASTWGQTLASSSLNVRAFGEDMDPSDPSDTSAMLASTSTKRFSDAVIEDLNIGTPGNQDDDLSLLEGDIIEGTSIWNSFTRKGVQFFLNLWPRINNIATVHYRIGSSGVKSDTILTAIAHFEEHTCLRFIPNGWFHIGTRINFETGLGCSSYLGHQWFRIFFGQSINLSSLCDSVHVVVHEIGHAIGLFHEQSRSDRDQHIAVLTKNIRPDRVNQFDKSDTKNFDTIYDLYSVMQYGPLAFSIGNTTIAAKDPMAQGLLVVPRTGLSFMDKLQVNRLYGCEKQWIETCRMGSSPCKNLGYLGASCTCVCPEGTEGNTCQTKTLDYTAALLATHLPLNARLTAEGSVATPGYPTPKEEFVVFTKIIEAPKCNRVVITVVGAAMAKRAPSPPVCYWEGVELRLGDQISSGKWYCGDELEDGQVMKSENNTAVIFYMRSKLIPATTKGFSFNFIFEDIGNCS